MSESKKIEYVIIRKDLFQDNTSLEKLLATYKEQNLDVEKEISKLIELGYIKIK